MAESVTFAFKNYQTVTIKAVNAGGFVHARMANQHGEEEYRVRFWLDGKRQDEWFYAHELEAA